MTNETSAVAATQLPVPLSATSAPAPAATARRHRASESKTAALSESTAAAYAKDIRLVKASGGVLPCDSTELLKYVAAMINKISPSTLHRRLMAVRHAHVAMGKPSPTDDPLVRPLLRSLQLGFVPDKKALKAGLPQASAKGKRREPKPSSPVTRRLLSQMLELPARNLLDRRDRAMLLLGFMGALNRSALVAINVGDLRFTSDAMIVTLRAQDEDLEASGASFDPSRPRRGRELSIPMTGGEMCAATAVRAWIEHAALDGEPAGAPLCRRFDRGGDPTSDRLDASYLSVIVKKFVKGIGLDPTPYSAHSLVIGRRAEAAKGVM